VIVLDASAAVDVLVGLGGYVQLRDRLDRPGETLHAPHLFDIEVASALRGLEAGRVIEPEQADLALRDLGDLSIARYPHVPLLGRIWELRKNVSAQDASYVALAEALGAPLVTADARLARVPGTSARFEVYAG